MSKKKTRRETLSLIGAASFVALAGCGDEGNAGSGAGPTTGGSAGTTGSSTSGTGGGGAGGAGGDGTGGGSSGGSGGSSGPGGTGGGSGGAGGGSGGNGGTAGSSGGSAGSGGGSGGTGGGSGGTGPDGGADAGRGGGGSGGAGGGKADAGPVQCQAKQEVTVGPYPNIDPLDRRDVRGNTRGNTTPKEGTQLTLRMRIYDLSNNCAPIEGAVVDIWACDAVGDYAGYSAFSTTGQDFCRGYQRTNAQGLAEFLTIFPGSYSGRAIHIHFSIQSMPRDLSPNANGPNLPNVMVAQLYFTRAVIDEIFAANAIYRQGAAITANDSDSIYRQGGKDLLVRMTKDGAGYIGEVEIGVRRSDIGL